MSVGNPPQTFSPAVAPPPVDAPPKRPNLRMLRPDLENLPPLEPFVAALPPSYHFRTYQPGDEAAWAVICNTMNADRPGEWDVTRTRQQLTGQPQFDPDGLFFVTHGPVASEAIPVGTACAWSSPNELGIGIVHMVVVLPEHRGHRLSYPLCLAVLHRFRQRGLPRARLGTGEYRLGAVKIYLSLGFQPVYRHPLNPEQWQGVVRQLGWTQPLTPFVEEPAGTYQLIGGKAHGNT